MYQQISMLGRLCADPEVRDTSSGARVVKVRLATDEHYKDRDGEWQKKTEFHNVVFWDREGEKIEKWCRKGDPLFVVGMVQTRSWETDDGSKRYMTEIRARSSRLLRSKRDRDEAPRERQDSGGWGDEPAPAGDGDFPF